MELTREQKQALALAKARRRRADRESLGETVHQGMSGVNEGIANILGAPVDLMTSGLNLASSGIDAATGVDLGQIENPAGGSGSLKGLLSPTISENEPVNALQRGVRRVGQEIGASAVPALAIAGRTAKSAGLLDDMTRAAQQNFGKFVGAETAAAAGSGVGAAAANEIAPGSQLAEIAGQLAGGGLSIAAMKPKAPKAPTLDDLYDRQGAAYDAVDSSTVRVAPAKRDEIVASIQDEATLSHMDAELHPKAARVAQKLEGLEPAPPINEMERARRLIGDNVAGAADRGERAVGVAMKGALDDQMGALKPEDIIGNPDEAKRTLAALLEGRDMTRRIRKAEMVSEGPFSAEERAIRRAASTGKGGNVVNATRQNIRAILDDPKKRRGFTADEIDQMERIVSGDLGRNALRLIAGFSPTSGVLPATTGTALYGGAYYSGNPALATLMAAIPTAGFGAKFASESISSSDIRKLSEMIRAGAPRRRGAISDGQKAAIAALLAAQSGQVAGPQ